MQMAAEAAEPNKKRHQRNPIPIPQYAPNIRRSNTTNL